MSRQTLTDLKKDNFSFLEKIRSIHTVNRIPVTISMGVATFPEEVIIGGKSRFNELADKAGAGLDLALGRGGDQAVVYEEDGSAHFYGGKTRTVEKNTRVRARVVAQAVHELIDTSDLVLIMGHEREDYDSVGAAVGVAHMARLAGKPCHIVISNQTSAIHRLQETMSDMPAYKSLFIQQEEAEDICNNQTLLFIVDVHRPDMTVAPQLLDKTDKRVVIDHHRRSSDFIKKPLLTYTEASSSSTCELVTELLQYYQEDIELEKIEATALYSGIVVDTKNFAVQTGVRTFDAAAYLRRSGADPEVVRELFSMDFDTVKERARVLGDAQISDGIAMASCPAGMKNITIMAAQVADLLITIDNVEASFTFYYLSEKVIGVSARSKGTINVQLVMEELGGGGHRTVAGVQLKGKTLAEAQGDVMMALRKLLNQDKEIDT
jgi:c-di-AMP phosphodiesterase-like protein